MVESTPVVSTWAPLDGDISDTKCSAAARSWRWEETLRVPGLGVDYAKRETEREAGGEEDEREEPVAGPLVVAVTNNEVCPHRSVPSSEAASTSVVVSGGDDAADDNERGDSDPSSSCQVGTTVDPSRGDSTDSSESLRVSESTVDDQQSSEGRAVAETSSPEANGCAKKKRGASFWSPRRGRTSTEATARDTKSSGASTNRQGSSGAVSTTPDVALVTGDERSGNSHSGSSSDPENSESDQHRQQPGTTKGLGIMSVRRSASSGQICPEVLVKVNNTVIGEGAAAAEGAHAEANDGGETRKQTFHFWGPSRRRGRRSHTKSGDTTVDEQDSQQAVLSRCDGEASTAFDISVPEESGDDRSAANKGKMERGPVPNDDPSIACVPHDSLHKKAGNSSFWSPRRKGNKGAKKAEAASDTHSDNDFGGTVTTGPCASVETTTKASHSGGQSAGRCRRAPPNVSTSTSEDVMLVEVWEVKGAAASNPSAKMNEASAVAVPECDDGETTEASPHARDSEESNSNNRPHLDGEKEAFNRLGSGEEPLPAQASGHARPLGATVETDGGPTPVNDDNSDNPATGNRDVDTEGMVATAEGCVEDDRVPAVGDEISAVANGASVAAGGATSTKTSRGKLKFLFPSPLKKNRGPKGEVPPQLPQLEPPAAPSETETPQGPISIDDGSDTTAVRGQPEEATPDAKGKRETSEATLDSGVPNVMEERSTDDDDDDDDANEVDGLCTARKAQRKRTTKTTSFLLSYKGKKTTTAKVSPRSSTKAKHVLWGRLTIRVADVLLAGTVKRLSDGDHLVGRQNVPASDGTDATETVSSSTRVSVESPAYRNGDGSSPSKFRVSMPRRGPMKDMSEQVETLGTISAGDEPDDMATGPSPHASDGWFEVEHPKGKHGKRAKGRVRLTVTCHEPHHASSDKKSVA